MAIELLADHPDYGNRMRQYKLDRAEAADDPAKQSQLDLEWEKSKTVMLQEAYVNRDRKRELELAKGAAGQKYPDVDPELYGEASTAEEVEKIASRMQASIAKVKPPTEGQTSTAEGGSWGGPPSAGAAGQAPAAAPQLTREEEMEQLRPALSKGRRALAENRRFAQLAASPWLDALEARAMANRSQTPPQQQ